MFINLISTNKSSREQQQIQGTKKKSFANREALSSKISNSGKKQKTKSDPTQNLIEQYLANTYVAEDEQRKKVKD